METIIVANWKMNPQSLPKAKELFNSVRDWSKKNSHTLQNVRIIICPPFVYLDSLSKLLKIKSSRPKVELGAQDLFWEEKGAFTGEVSPKMLKNLGVKYAIVGHSERRQILGETDEMINKKLKAAIKMKIKPILCIGETLKERKKGKTFQILKHQLIEDLRSLAPRTYNPQLLIIAYEPVWAIGTGKPCKTEDAKEVLLFLRKFTQSLFHSTIQTLILYGGSVNSKIAKDYIKIGFDGLLVGSASLKQKEFVGIIKNIVKD